MRLRFHFGFTQGGLVVVTGKRKRLEVSVYLNENSEFIVFKKCDPTSEAWSRVTFLTVHSHHHKSRV